MKNTLNKQNFIMLLFSFVLLFSLFSFVVINKTYTYASDSKNLGEISVMSENGLSFSFQETWRRDQMKSSCRTISVSLWGYTDYFQGFQAESKEKTPQDISSVQNLTHAQFSST